MGYFFKKIEKEVIESLLKNKKLLIDINLIFYNFKKIRLIIQKNSL